MNKVPEVELEKLIPERYRLENFLGSGGFGQVYNAFDSTLLRYVAIKVIKYEHSEALLEAQALARCNSPNIVEVHDVIHNENYLAIVMEKVESKLDLDVTAIADMEKNEFLSFFLQVSKAVSDIHAAGLLHLDLKPSNILFTDQKAVKVSDFGLSTHQASQEGNANYSYSGSWECLSPEHLQQKPVSTATDVFALGILLYNYLFKAHPFVVEGDISATEENILGARINYQQQFRCAIPELEVMVRAMLDKTPRNRPSMQQVFTAIENLHHNDNVPMETVELDLPKAKASKLDSKLLYAATSVVVVISGVVFFLPSLTPVATTLVIPPLYVDSAKAYEGDAESRRDRLLLAAIVEDEIVSSVINDPQRSLVSKKEWRGTKDWAEEARLVDVDQIIISNLNCSIDFCDVNLSVYSRKKDGISKLTSKKIPTSDLLVFAQVIEQILVSDLDFTAHNTPVLGSISDSDLRLYYNIKKKLEDEEFTEADVAGLKQLSQDNPGFLGAQLLLAGAYRNLYMNFNVDRWLQQSQELMLQLNDRFPANPSVMYQDFHNKLLAHDLTGAEKTLSQLKRVIGVETTRLAISEAMLIFSKQPKEGYQKLLQHENPRLTHSYFHHRAYMEETLKEFDTLEQTCIAWAKRFPDTYLPKFFLANSYLVTSRLQEAETLYIEILKKKSDHDIVLNLGITQMLLGRYNESIENFKKALEYSPGSREIYLNLAESYKALESKESKQYFLQALTLYSDKNADQDYAHKALILAHLNRNEDAIIELQKAAQLNNKAGEFFFIAAQVYQLLGQDRAARYNAEEAVAIGFGKHWFRVPWTQPLYDYLSNNAN